MASKLDKNEPTMTNRFTDDGLSFFDHWDHWIVACPGCGKPVDYRENKVACIHCGFSKAYSGNDLLLREVPHTAAVRSYLALPCCGHTLWAVNLEHLDLLERYVGATLRERLPNMNRSMVSRLPQWIKEAKHRDEILAGIQKLRALLDTGGYKPNKAKRVEALDPSSAKKKAT